MKLNAGTILRFIVGIPAVVFGLNAFLHFMPTPEMTGDAGTLMSIYAGSGFMKLISVIQIIAGLCLLSGKFIPLATTFITAIFFNAVLFHVFHDMKGIGMSLIFLLLTLGIVATHRDKFAALFKA